MLQQLVLVRHAKSDWGDPSLADHDRALNARGTRDASIIAQRFAEAGQHVDVILSSTAVRAHRTAEAFDAALGLEVAPDPELYLAYAEQLLAKAVRSKAESVMLVAHNLGVTDLSSYLSGGEIDHMPTCAIAGFIWAEASLEASQRGATMRRPPNSWSMETPRLGLSASGTRQVDPALPPMDWTQTRRRTKQHTHRVGFPTEGTATQSNSTRTRNN